MKSKVINQVAAALFLITFLVLFSGFKLGWFEYPTATNSTELQTITKAEIE